ncbi:MAG: hypothetical protein ACI9CE_001292 [Flavobacterium sp.]|jgi:hypothetical protein
MVMDSHEQADVELRRKDEQIRLSYVDIQNLHARIDKLTREKRNAEFDLEEVYASFSWRVSGILRVARYLLWTLPILVFQWGQRIFLDKGLIRKTGISLEKIKGDKKSVSLRNRPSKNQLPKRGQPKKTSVKKSKMAEYLSLPELRDNLLLSEYETKYVVDPKSDNTIWNQNSLGNYTQSGIVNYDLRNPGIFRRQAKMALKMGIDGFCYHYDENAIDENFDGPIMNHYRNTDTELCYLVCWSNESVPSVKFNLLENFHLRKFIEYCGRLFDDTRYVYYQNRPVIVIQGLSKQQENLAKEVWQRWAEEEDAIMPFILPLDEEVLQPIVDLSSVVDINLLRDQFMRESSHKILALHQHNVDLAPAILNNIRRFSCRGELIFLSSWNNWDQAYNLESNDSSLVKLQSSMNRIHSSISQEGRNRIAIAVTMDIEPNLINQIVCCIRELGLTPHLLLLDEDSHKFPGIDSTRLFGKSGSTFFDSILLRLERNGCHTLLSFVNLHENLNEALVNSGWYLAQLDKAQLDKTQINKNQPDYPPENVRLSLRKCIQESGMILPNISVICEVTASTDIEQIKRFVAQVEDQHLIPEEIIFAGDYRGEMISSEKIEKVTYRKEQVLNLSGEAKSDLLWLTQIETMPSRNLLKVVSRKLGEHGAVIYPFHAVSGESDIRDRSVTDISLFRTKTSLDDTDIVQANSLGRFKELVLRRSDLVDIVERFSPLQGVFDTQKDWILWLLIAQRGSIIKDVQSKTSSLAVQPASEADNFRLEQQVIKSYFGSTKDLSHFNKEDWPEIKAKLIILDKALTLHLTNYE